MTVSDPFVGRWFQRLCVEDNGDVGYGWQGQVLAGDGVTYMVQLYGWLNGDPRRQRPVKMSEMLGSDWEFFSTAVDMAIARGCMEVFVPGANSREPPRRCSATPTHLAMPGYMAGLVCDRHARWYPLAEPI